MGMGGGWRGLHGGGRCYRATPAFVCMHQLLVIVCILVWGGVEAGAAVSVGVRCTVGLRLLTLRPAACEETLGWQC